MHLLFTQVNTNVINEVCLFCVSFSVPELHTFQNQCSYVHTKSFVVSYCLWIEILRPYCHYCNIAWMTRGSSFVLSMVFANFCLHICIVITKVSYTAEIQRFITYDIFRVTNKSVYKNTEP